MTSFAELEMSTEVATATGITAMATRDLETLSTPGPPARGATIHQEAKISRAGIACHQRRALKQQWQQACLLRLKQKSFQDVCL